MSSNPIYTPFEGEDEDTGDIKTIHPVIARMLIEPPSDADVVYSWDDDHCLCVRLDITYPDQVYHVEWMWVNPSALVHLGKTINNLQESIKFAGKFTEK